MKVGFGLFEMTKMTSRFTTTLLVAEAPTLSPEISFSLPLSLDSEAWWDFSREVGGVFINNLSSQPPLWNLPPLTEFLLGKNFLPACVLCNEQMEMQAAGRWRRRSRDVFQLYCRGWIDMKQQQQQQQKIKKNQRGWNVELQVCQPPPGFSNLCLQQFSGGTRSSGRSFVWSPVWASELDNTASILLMLYVILMTAFDSVCVVFHVAGWR